MCWDISYDFMHIVLALLAIVSLIAFLPLAIALQPLFQEIEPGAVLALPWDLSAYNFISHLCNKL